MTPTQNHAAVGIDVRKFTTPNGIAVVYSERTSIPMVSMDMKIDAGSYHDDPRLSGTANLVAEVLINGTEKMDGTAIVNKLDFLGASLEINAGKDYVSVSVRCLKKDIDEVFGILADILTAPGFHAKDIERVKKIEISKIMYNEDDEGYLASLAFWKKIFGDIGYGLPIAGAKETIPKISKGDMVAFFKRFYRPENTSVGLSGAMNGKEIEALFDRHFGAWQGGKSGPSDPIVVPADTKSEIVIERNKTQSSVIIGLSGMRRDNPDYYRLYLANHILGSGDFECYLMKEMREKKGLTYGVSSGAESLKRAGVFSIQFQTKTASTMEAIGVALKAVDKITNKPIDSEVLANAKSYLTGSFALRLNSNSKLASYLSFIAFHNLPTTYFDDFITHVNKATAAEIRAVAKKYILPENFTTVIVGKKK